MTEEEKLNIPENAISVEDFLKDKKKEEQAVEVERPKESLDLKVMEVKKSEELGLNDAQKKQKKKRERKGNKD